MQAGKKSPETIHDQWQEKHYAELSGSIERVQIEDAINIFREFCELPEETKRSLNVPGDKGRGKGSLGYVERKLDTASSETTLGKEPEHKAYFHYHPRIETELGNEIHDVGPIAENMVGKMRAMWIKIEEKAFTFIERLETENANDPRYQGLIERFSPDGLTRAQPELRHPKLMLRLMFYKKVTGNNVLSANNHYDAGSFGFAICESKPGLQVGEKGKEDEMVEVSRPDGTTLVWPGTNYKQIDPTIEPTWHGVTQHTTDNVKLGEENRWVAVAFLDEYNEIIPTIEETHGVS